LTAEIRLPQKLPVIRTTKFLWNGKRDKVKRGILTNSYGDGGLKMIDVKLFYQALKMTWIKKICRSLNFFSMENTVN
jgi:hypothetical protein